MRRKIGIVKPNPFPKTRLFASLCVIGCLCAGVVFWKRNLPSNRLVSAIISNDTRSAIRALEEGASPNTELSIYAGPLSRGSFAFLEPLLRKPEFRGSVVVAAAESNNTELVRALIERGANVNAVDQRGDTALIYVAGLANLTLVRFLLDHGANVNSPGLYGDTPLICAAQGGSLECVKCLLAHGADRRPKDCFGMTASDYAGGPHDHSLLKSLLK